MKANSEKPSVSDSLPSETVSEAQADKARKAHCFGTAISGWTPPEPGNPGSSSRQSVPVFRGNADPGWEEQQGQ